MAWNAPDPGLCNVRWATFLVVFSSFSNWLLCSEKCAFYFYKTKDTDNIHSLNEDYLSLLWRLLLTQLKPRSLHYLLPPGSIFFTFLHRKKQYDKSTIRYVHVNAITFNNFSFDSEKYVFFFFFVAEGYGSASCCGRSLRVLLFG